MTKFLDNGTVMPHGLLSCNPSDFSRGFNKSYNNTALRFGVIKNIYSVNDPNNVSNLSTEYDVDVIEQDMNRGIAPVTYKNCLSVDGLGSIADYFEKNFRVQTQSDNLQLPLTKGQNGATVLVLCLDATTGKGIILGGLKHPDRPTNLTSAEPQLYGEYNGVAVQINPDGSTSLTFNGATDNNGNLVTPGQGPTTVAISTDGTFSVSHSGATVHAYKSGDVNIAATGNVIITAQGDVDITSQGNTNITASEKVVVMAPEIDLNGNSSDPGRGVTSSNSHEGVIDLITGVPVDPSTTVFIDV